MKFDEKIKCWNRMKMMKLEIWWKRLNIEFDKNIQFVILFKDRTLNLMTKRNFKLNEKNLIYELYEKYDGWIVWIFLNYN